MTPQQFAKKYPNSVINDNCLRDIACSECGSRENFYIEISSTAEMSDEGTEDHGDSSHDESSYCSCIECGVSDSVKSFTIEGLDALLIAKEKA